MLGHICFIGLLAVCTVAIRVPVDGKEEIATDIIKVNESAPTQSIPIYYESEESNVDSYLIPPDPHKQEADDAKSPLATYLLPPAQDKQDEYIAPDTGSQSEWYPIPQSLPQNSPSVLLPVQNQEPIPILFPDEQQHQFASEKIRTGKSQQLEALIPVPSRELQPPLENAPNDYIVPIAVPSKELELPLYENSKEEFNAPSSEVYELPMIRINQKFNPILTKNTPVNFRVKPVEPTLSLHLTPPKPLLTKHKNPTKLYPKKYPGGFKPVPIPIAQFAEGSLLEVPRAKPVTPFNPVLNNESEFSPPVDKETYLFKKAEQKRKLRKEKAAKHQQAGQSAEEPQHAVAVPSEQETSETNYRYPGRNAYPAPLRAAPPTPPPAQHAAAAAGHAPAHPPPAGDRTEFRMHGMKGPHSYQFGYDTGKGKNRQFRYEERDNDGHVKGHYGYVDRLGKLRVVNYDAHPEHGFHAEVPEEKEQ